MKKTRGFQVTVHSSITFDFTYIKQYRGGSVLGVFALCLDFSLPCSLLSFF